VFDQRIVAGDPDAADRSIRRGAQGGHEQQEERLPQHVHVPRGLGKEILIGVVRLGGEGAGGADDPAEGTAPPAQHPSQDQGGKRRGIGGGADASREVLQQRTKTRRQVFHDDSPFGC